MERRRQIALKALSERLSKVEPLPAPGPVSWEPAPTTSEHSVEISIPSEEPTTVLPTSTDRKIVETELAKT
uniref:Uncharacterized protein n=2 Tax=Timema TaxID=61471 RepID=A0A7R9DNY0_TIMPO|nr:unnamed protein product [Timema poppensis]